MGELPGQISIFDMLNTVSDVSIENPWKAGPEKLLEAAVLQGSGYQDGRIRIFAMMSSGEWPQYRENWIRDEYGTGGFSMRFAPGWFCDYGIKGLRCRDLRHNIEYSYTWKQVLQEIQRQMDEDFYLNPEEEKKVERIIMERGCLPYPRPRLAYPGEAWTKPIQEEKPC